MDDLLKVLSFFSGDLLHTRDQLRDIRKTGFREYGLRMPLHQKMVLSVNH